MSFAADIDIDVAPAIDRNRYGIRAIMYDEAKESIVAHPSGIYVDCHMNADEEMPTQATISYEEAETVGFTKLDLLTNSSYDLFDSKAEVLRLLAKEPEWTMLEEQEVCDALPQISGHIDLIRALKPKSIEDLADLLALIRPGKIHLLSRYTHDKVAARKELYTKVSAIYFKKSHAVAYAHMIVCVMNKMLELISEDAL